MRHKNLKRFAPGTLQSSCPHDESLDIAFPPVELAKGSDEKSSLQNVTAQGRKRGREGARREEGRTGKRDAPVDSNSGPRRTQW
jgi:hypothetical protein